MPLSPRDEVRAFYDDAADGYNHMMDEEIKLPSYHEFLSALADRIATVDGPVLDTSCGSGHMLEKLGRDYAPGRELLGLDLSPEMVAIARHRLGDAASVSRGDMSDLAKFSDATCAAVISFFGIHHVGVAELPSCLSEWHRILVPRGQLLIAAWEGTGVIDYGDQSDLMARRYAELELVEAVNGVGFRIDTKSVRPVEGFEMDAVYLTASKSA